MPDTTPLPAFDMDSFMASYAAYEKRAGELNPANKANLLGALAAAGVTSVIVNFDGGGDSGQIESIVAQAGDSQIDLPDTPVELARTEFHAEEITRVTMPLPEAIEAFCYDVLESKHGGWENNEGGFGEFTFDVAAGTVAFDFNYRIQQSENHYYEL